MTQNAQPAAPLRTKELPPENGKTDLLNEVMQNTVDLREKLGKRWGIVTLNDVDLFARSFISSKSQFGWEVTHQFETICHELDLNPARKEIAAFYSPDKGLTSFVMIDGWLTLANRQPDFEGWELDEHREGKDLFSYTCRVFRRGKPRPTVVSVKMSEWRMTDSPQWRMKPEWMLQIKAIKQGIRLAYGFAGVVDDDDAYAMMHEAAPKPEPKGAKVENLKAAEAPPADEHSRKKPEASKPRVPAPKASLKLEDAKPPAPASQPMPEPEDDGDGEEVEPPLAEAPPAETKAAPPVEEKKPEPSKPQLEPIICGQRGREVTRKQPEEMDKAEVHYAVTYNAAAMLKTKDPAKLEARREIEAALVERGLELGMTPEDFEAEDFVKAGEEAPKEAPAAPQEAPKPVEEPKQPPKAAEPPQKAIDAKGAAAWVTEKRKGKKLALGVFAKLAAIDPTTMAALESGDLETWKRQADDTVKEMGRILGDPEAATLMGLLGRA